jgi:anaerobic magnesium-protoporphyrin IX monomethyl ester cyclase
MRRRLPAGDDTGVGRQCREGLLLVYPPGGPPSEVAPLGVPLLKAALRQRRLPVSAIDMQPRALRLRNGFYHLVNRLLPLFSGLPLVESKKRFQRLIAPLLRSLRIRRQLHRSYSGRSINAIVENAMGSALRHTGYRCLQREIRRCKASLIGFSVVYPEQLFHALLLARMLKREVPQISVLMGGAQITKHIRLLRNWTSIERAVDGMVVKDGLPALAGWLEKRPPDALPNLYYLDGRNGFQKSSCRTPPMTEKGGIPDFSDFRFSVLPLRASVGCAWGRCSFCTYRLFYDGYCRGSVQQLVRTMRSHRRRFRVSYFRIIDDFMPPAFLKAFSIELLQSGLLVHWWAFMALVPGLTPHIASLMRQAGCRSIETGLESMSPRILSLMGKPHTPESARKSFALLHAAGIDIVVDVMFGFPSETEAEAQETLDYLQGNRHLFKSINIQQFCLEEDTEIYRHPQQYGIVKIDYRDKCCGVRKGLRFETLSGMTTDESRSFTEKALALLAYR